jgi:signal transduction histidine kinase
VEKLPPEREPHRFGDFLERLRRSPPRLIALAAAPVVVAALIALAELPREPVWVFPCPLYPNGSVALTASLHASCPIEFTEHPNGYFVGADDGDILRGDAQVRALVAGGNSADYRVQPLVGPWRRVTISPLRVTPVDAAVRLASALVIAAILVGSAVLTIVRAGVAASAPFSLMIGVLAASVVSTVAGWTSSSFEILGAFTRASMAGALAHFALVFPQRRGIVEDFPELIATPYVMALIVAGVEIDNAYRGSAVSTGLALRLLLVGAGISACLLPISCYTAATGSQSHIARGQARLFLAGMLFLVLPVSLGWWFGTPDTRLTAATLLAALLPMPIGYAVARYELWDLDANIREVAAHAIYLSIWSGGFFVAIQLAQDHLALPDTLRHPTVLYAAIYAVLVPVDFLRERVKRGLRGALLATRVDWDRLGREFARQIAAARSKEGIAEAVSEAVRAGLTSACVAVYLKSGRRLELAHALGRRAFVERGLAERIGDWASEPVVDLTRVFETDGPAREGYDSGVGAFAHIEASGERIGCILVLAERGRRMLSTSERHWIATVAGHAAAAFAAMRVEQELRVAERFAARGRMESELAHEIGKPLGAIEIEAQHLAQRLAPEPELAGGLARIAAVAKEARELTRRALKGDGKKTRARLEDLVQRACLEIHTLHGPNRVAVHGMPKLGELPAGFERLTRVLVNLMDNGLRASGDDGIVDLRVNAPPRTLEIEVIDHGTGMTPDQLRRAFEPFASFRDGGSGLGLSISRQTVEQLGGDLTLEPNDHGGGMRAALWIPR